MRFVLTNDVAHVPPFGNTDGIPACSILSRTFVN